MNVSEMFKKIQRGVVKNLPTIATCVGVGGVITTVGLTIKIAPKAKKIYEEELKKKPDMNLWDKTKILAPLYWPVALSGTLSIGCILFANSENLKRNASAIAAYQLSETALNEFKEAAKKTVGEKKTREIQSKVAEEEVKINPVSKSQVIITNNGDQLCYDSISGRYFMSTIEKIRQAVNVINRRLMVENVVSLNEFYDLLGLEGINIGDTLGWNMNSMNDMLDILFDSVVADDGRPALVMKYEITPTYDFYDF